LAHKCLPPTQSSQQQQPAAARSSQQQEAFPTPPARTSARAQNASPSRRPGGRCSMASAVLQLMLRLSRSSSRCLQASTHTRSWYLQQHSTVFRSAVQWRVCVHCRQHATASSAPCRPEPPPPPDDSRHTRARPPPGDQHPPPTHLSARIMVASSCCASAAGGMALLYAHCSIAVAAGSSSSAMVMLNTRESLPIQFCSSDLK
jgi:hypothetical protein